MVQGELYIGQTEKEAVKLPVWELNLQRKKEEGAIRRVHIDGVFDKHLELE